jgi:hypothetical protein
MMGIDQSIVFERQKTFGKLIDGVLLCGSEHFNTEIQLRVGIALFGGLKQLFVHTASRDYHGGASPPW